MLIGIMSDSHNHHHEVRKALAKFNQLSVEHIIHCGDVGGHKNINNVISMASLRVIPLLRDHQK